MEKKYSEIDKKTNEQKNHPPNRIALLKQTIPKESSFPTWILI